MSSNNPLDCSVNDVLEAIKRNETKLALVDVRPEAKKALMPGKIGNAVNIPMGETLFNDLQMNNSQFKEKYGIDLPDEKDTVIFHCNQGNGSMFMVNSIKEKYPGLWEKYNFRNWPGGLESWQKQFE